MYTGKGAGLGPHASQRVPARPEHDMAARSPSRVSGCRRTACRGWSTPTPRRRPWTHPGESARVSTGSRRLGGAQRIPGERQASRRGTSPREGAAWRAPMRQAAAGRRPAPRGAPPRPASRFRVRPVLACAAQRTRRRAAPRRTHDLADERAADDEAQVDGVALHEGVVDGHERHGGRRRRGAGGARSGSVPALACAPSTPRISPRVAHRVRFEGRL